MGRTLAILETQIETIPADALDGLPKLYKLYLHNTNLENMATGLFRHMDSSSVQLRLDHGNLTHLKSHHFAMKNASIRQILLNDNQIATVDVDTFKDLNCVHKCNMDMRNNLLTTLPEAVWR